MRACQEAFFSCGNAKKHTINKNQKYCDRYWSGNLKKDLPAFVKIFSH